MTLKKENAAPDVVVGAATGQHLCNSEISIPNAAPAGNEKIAGRRLIRNQILSLRIQI